MKEKNFINKLFARIGGIALAISLALGVGTGIALNNKANAVYAVDNTTTYTFTSKSWSATSGGSSANWTSGQDGAGFSNNGIQVTTATSGANGTSPVSFTNVVSVVLTYNTNKSAGAGSFDVKVGNNTPKNVNWAYSSGDGRTANYTATANYSASPETGNIKITINTTTNSCYLVACSIVTESGGEEPPASTFTVTYDANGGTGTMTDSNSPYSSGATVTVLNNSFARDGYTFSHWDTAQDDSGTDYNPGATFTISANTTLYAQWSEADRTVTYNPNGATGGSVPTDDTVYSNGATVTVLGNSGSLVRTGYIWSGWNTKADGTGISYAAGSTFAISSATTLYARWIYSYSNETEAIITADYLNLNNTGISSAATLTADDGIQYSAAPGGANSVKATDINGSSSNKFNNESPILMGKNGAYLFNKDAFPKSIYKIEVFANHGASQNVAVAVAFDDDAPCSSSYTTGAQTLNPYNAVYTFNCNVENARYFRIQVTNANNAQVQIKVLFNIPTTSVTVSPASVTLNPGDTQQLTSTVLPANNTDTLSYSSSNSNVATVSNDGLITAKGVGQATITAISGAASGTCVVTVELPPDPFITPDDNEISGYTGQNATIDFIYGNLSDELGISTNNSNITASIQNDDGLGNAEVAIAFNTTGSSEIYLKDGSTTLATISVTILTSMVTITGLSSTGSVYIDATLDLGATINVTATGIYNDTVTWSSEDSNIATVNAAGVVTGVAAGTVDITVTSNGYPSATQTCTVTVSRDARWDTEFATTMVADIELPAGGEDTDESYYVVAQITAITNSNYGNGNAVDKDGTAFAIYGMYNYNGTVAYSSMVAEEKPVVDDFVVLYGVFCKYNNKPEIKNARVVQRNGVTFQAEVLTGVSLNKSSLLLGVGCDFDLEASPLPNNAELGNVTWTSSDNAIASVSSSGVVTGVAAGSVVITAEAGGFSASCNVTVSLSDTLQYSGSTTNMTATGNAALVNLDSNLFTVDAAKGGNNNFPGLNTNGETRAYNGNDIIVTIDSAYTITSAVFDYADGSSYSQVYADGTLVSGNDGVYAINGESFKIHANGGTIKIRSIEIFYREANSPEKVSRLSTQASLAFSDYNDEGDGTFTFANLKIRFKGLISQDLYEDLENVTGYGILLTTTDVIDDDPIKNYYALAEDYQSSPDAKHDVINFTNTKATPTLSGGYYGWSLHQSIAAEDIATTYVAAAYIILDGDNVVFLNEIRVSAQSIADGLIKSGAVAEDEYGGSIKYLADQ